MLDYLKKYGCVPLSDAPFNDADRLVLAQAAYLNFPGGLPSGTPLKEALTGVSFLPDEPSETRFGFQHKDDIALRDLMIASARYREMRFAGANRCLTPEGQFAVFSILLPDGTLVISFRGTDNTLAGWKEDCDLSYKEEIPAQRMACEYVEEMAASADRIELLGHSKGGNLALYAASACSYSLHKRIAQVFCVKAAPRVHMEPAAAHIAEHFNLRKQCVLVELCIPRPERGVSVLRCWIFK